MSNTFIISKHVTKEAVLDFVYNRKSYISIKLDDELINKTTNSRRNFEKLIENNVPIYGVTTGFGESCFRAIDKENSELLQKNLVDYLSCGTGKELTPEVSRAIFLLRLISLSKGYSGVSIELINRMVTYLENDWLPIIPCEGSLGASGDLIPLAYLAQIIQGNGKVYANDQVQNISILLNEKNLKPYKLKSKEGLALVNGTSAMAGLALTNLSHISYLYETSVLCTAWLCLVLKGRTEAYDVLVNQKAKDSLGQAKTATMVKKLIDEEEYKSKNLSTIQTKDNYTCDFIQDPYSMRCTPQILGPVYDTIELFGSWLGHEINGVSDNPLIDENGNLANGGNFYGGYISHGMDYLKICLAHIADQMDRQLTLLISDKTNRGLTPNLINWPDNNSERHLHHGLKGLHQLGSAITSEIIAKSMPNGVFSRSSESHNQDKVSLGMSAACQCTEVIDKVYNLFSAYLICLAQAVDLREIKFKGRTSKEMYSKIRSCTGFVDKDTRLDGALQKLSTELKQLAKIRNN